MDKRPEESADADGEEIDEGEEPRKRELFAVMHGEESGGGEA